MRRCTDLVPVSPLLSLPLPYSPAQLPLAVQAFRSSKFFMELENQPAMCGAPFHMPTLFGWAHCIQ